MSGSVPPVSSLVAGKYEVSRLIGRGGMGSVWEGKHTSLGTRVAVKFIDAEYADSKEARARFVTEARAAATIQSRHAIQIFDHGVTDDGRPYMVMELLDGEPLDKRIDRLKALSLDETARLLRQVCRALQRAHDAGIIHRDLKPENIFVVRSPDEDEEVAKVLDFGIAKIKDTSGEKGLTGSTKTGAVLGTPYYMSPEQARGLRNLDHRTDIWSLGVIAYKCVTGVLPFEGESVGDLLVRICTAPAPVPSMTKPGLPKAFDAWFARALEREVPRRFASASELADALAEAAGQTVRARLASGSLDPDAAITDDGLARASTLPRTLTDAPVPMAGVTSAPFTAPTTPARPRRSRGAITATIAAAVLGGALGITGVLRLASRPSPGGEAGVTGTAGMGVNAALAPSTARPAIEGASRSLPPLPGTAAAGVATGTSVTSMTGPASATSAPATGGASPCSPATPCSAALSARGPTAVIAVPAASPASTTQPGLPAGPFPSGAWVATPPVKAAGRSAGPVTPPPPVSKPVRPPPASADPGY